MQLTARNGALIPALVIAADVSGNLGQPRNINEMTKGEPHKQNFQRLTMTICFLLFGSTVFSQVTSQQLDKYYQNNQTAELEKIFFSLNEKTQANFTKSVDNDTLQKISDLFNLILPDRQRHETTIYFFLQSHFPETFIDNKELTFTNKFIASTTLKNLRPILYDYQTIYEILKFIGTSPYDNPTVKEYLKDKEKLRKSKFKKAKKLIEEYKNKMNFISQFVMLPATWGKMDRGLVPYKINSLKFNTNLTEVEVIYDMTWRGATEIYNFKEGKWQHLKTIVMWAD